MAKLSCVIPTKNRASLLPGLLRSLREQAFRDFEVIVIDNDDTDATARVLAKENDSRLGYVRTGGLSMWENWNRSIQSASGEYVMIIYDKMRLRGNALERIDQILCSTRASVLTWRNFGCAEEGVNFGEKYQSCEVREIDGATLMVEASTGKWKGFNRLAPRGVNCAIKRTLIESVEKEWGRQICQPGSPDYVLAFTLLLTIRGFYHVDETFYDFLLKAPSNGGDALSKRDSAGRIAINMGCALDDLYRYVPVKYLSSNNVILNDLVRVLSEHSQGLEKYPVFWPRYYIELIQEILQMKAMGVESSEERRLLKMAFRDESLAVKLGFIKEIFHEFSWQVKRNEMRGPAWNTLKGRIQCLLNG